MNNEQRPLNPVHKRYPMTGSHQKGLRLLTFVILGLALMMALLLWRSRVAVTLALSPRVEAVSVSRTNLVLVSGLLRLAGQDRPFNGLMLEHWADGSLRSRSAVTNGLLHGPSEGWHTNGQLQVVEYFREGVSHGLRTKWYPGGKKLSEVKIVAGKLGGTFRRWSESGVLVEQVEFSEGQPHGIAIAYFESGFVKTWARMKHGKLIEQKSWKDGEGLLPTTKLVLARPN